MFAIGSVRTLIIENITKKKIELDLDGFLTNVVLGDLNMAGTACVCVCVRTIFTGKERNGLML